MILHEEAEDGNAMPDLERPVQAVSKAVANLVKVTQRGEPNLNKFALTAFTHTRRPYLPLSTKRVTKQLLPS